MNKKSMGQNHRNMNQNQLVGGMKKIWPKLFLVGVAGVSCAFGALSALLLAATPLKIDKKTVQTPQISESLSSIIPATLGQPVNILLLGIDNSGHDDVDKYTVAEGLAGNSDTMLLVRLIPATHQINILSIPRDTLVQIAGVGIDKINDANVVGGAQLAVKIVSNALSNIPIHRYVRIDTEAFARIVDSLGGVEINIPKDMHYEDHSQKLKISFKAGEQRLNGQHLQEYVRFRHDELGDIGRVQRQQQVLKALLQSVLQPRTIVKLPEILQVAKNNIDTNLEISEMLAIGQFLVSSGKEKMNMVMLPGRFSRPHEYPLSYWIEDPEKASPILEQYFDFHTQIAEDKKVNEKTDYAAALKSTKIAILNATGREESGIKTLVFFQNQGFENAYISDHEVDSAKMPLSESQIIVQNGNQQVAQALKDELGIGQIKVESTGDIWSDITVVVGIDLAARVEQMGVDKRERKQ